jgi:DNA replication and repair protein RecF
VIINKLIFKNYRNYKTLFFEPHPVLNIISGNNAQGKSNLLESIYYLSFLNSFRTNSSKKIINWEEDFFKISCDLNKKNELFNIDIICTNDNKEVKINGLKIDNGLNYYGLVCTVLFTPDDIQIIKGGPNYRRKYLDKQIFQIYPRYYGIFNKFNKILHQRNMLLKQIRNGNQGSSQLEIWNEQYSSYVYEIIKRRLSAFKKIRTLAYDYHKKLTDNKEELKLYYKMSGFSLDNDYLPSKENINSNINYIYEKEIEKGITLIGPHRDEIDIAVNSNKLREFGSQGQQRTATLSLKLAELEFISSETGDNPILLLDDVMSELDDFRQKLLTKSMSSNIQTFITTTDKSIGNKLDRDNLEFIIRNGAILDGG